MNPRVSLRGGLGVNEEDQKEKEAQDKHKGKKQEENMIIERLDRQRQV